MSDSSASKPAEKRSYLGIGSCCVFAIATACVIAWAVALAIETDKMAGFEAIVLLPFAFFLYVMGEMMGLAGMERPANNPLSRTGVTLNLLPLFVVVLAIVGSVIRTYWLESCRHESTAATSRRLADLSVGRPACICVNARLPGLVPSQPRRPDILDCRVGLRRRAHDSRLVAQQNGHVRSTRCSKADSSRRVKQTSCSLR